jgi:peptide/nickel transport system permease protein
MIPALLGVSIIIFGIIHFIPGDPITFMLGRRQDPTVVAALQAQYGLDRPLPVQYIDWLGKALRGDLGASILTGDSVSAQILERLPRTLYLLIGSMLIAVAIAVPCGILAAAKHNTWADLGITTGSLVALSIPSFWLAIILILLFAVQLQILPATGFVYPQEDLGEFLRHMIIPCFALGAIEAALITRIMRSSMLDALRQDYVTLARAKGAGQRRVLFIHALRNAAIPVATVVALEIGYLLGGAIIIERVFAYPGMGYLLITAIVSRDYPVIQGTILVFALLFFLVNLATDVIYTFLDPRIRYT